MEESKSSNNEPEEAPKYNIYKFNKDVERLTTKLGLPEDLAIIVACAHNNVPEMAQHYVHELQDEQSLIKSELSNFTPLETLSQTVTEFEK